MTTFRAAGRFIGADTREIDLDGRMVMPGFIDNHAHFIRDNSVALELAGITSDTPDPDGGTIVRDPNTGEPAGILGFTKDNSPFEGARMNTRVLMGLSALFMAILGFVATFLPQEILAYSGSQASGFVVYVVQIAGALYWGFAILNWMARANLIGGIYSRPVALGNFLHFVMVALTMWRVLAGGQNTIEIILGAAIYTAFAASFGLVLFMQPRPVKQGGNNT